MYILVPYGYNFFDQNWLKPYGAFCFLRDFFETSDHTQWGRFSHFSSEKVLENFFLIFESSMNVSCKHHTCPEF